MQPMVLLSSTWDTPELLQHILPVLVHVNMDVQVTLLQSQSVMSQLLLSPSL